MRKILIVSYYELRDYLSCIKDMFIQYKYSVVQYPLFRYAYDTNDKIADYKSHFVNLLKKEQPDIILWWFLDVPKEVFTDVFEMYVRPLCDSDNRVYTILYNSDDPSNMGSELLEKAEFFDLILTPCLGSVPIYQQYTKKNTHFLPFGYDPRYFFPIEQPNTDELGKYNADISVILYTMYDDPYYQQHIPRTKLVEGLQKLALYYHRKIKIYGPTTISEYCPDLYCGDVEYLNINKIVNYSKLVISTRPFCDKSLPTTDIDIQIMGSGGVMFIDKMKDAGKIFKDGVNCFVLNNFFIEQLNNMLRVYDTNPEILAQIKKKIHIDSLPYTWQNWTRTIHMEISRFFFDGEIYKTLYGPDATWETFVQDGVKTHIHSIPLKTLEIFDDESYKSFNDMNTDEKVQIFKHWYESGMSEKFLKNNKSVNTLAKISSDGGGDFDLDKLGIDMDGFYESCVIFAKIHNNVTLDMGLNMMHEFCKQYPYADINRVLDIYLTNV